jgi:protein subunit release factor A
VSLEEAVSQPNKPSLVVEIRAAEGGDDAKALVKEQVALYARLAIRREL